MTPDEERLRQFGAMIGRLIRKENLSRAEAKECWRQICMREQPDLQQGAFMAALAAKPETLDEIAGTFDALYEYDTTKVAIDTPEPIIDNAGSGGDTLKTFNISTAAAIVAAACGLYVVRHCSRGTTSNCGAVDVIEALGVDVECEPDIPKQAIERIGICAWNGFVKWLRPTFLARAPQEIRFGNTVNFVGPLLTPTMPKYKVMGVKSLEAVDFMARLFMESFNGKLRDECLNEHVFSSLAQARHIIEAWRIDYNTVRPHSSLGYLTPEEFAASWRAAPDKQQQPDAAPRPATGRAAAVLGASASRPVAGTPTAGQTENRLNL